MKEVTKYESWDGKIFDSKEECKVYEIEHRPTHPYFVEMELSGIVSVQVQAIDAEHAKEIARNSFFPEEVGFEITSFFVNRMN